jgi:hypothetical protein
MALDEELIARSNRSNEEADNSESDASDSDFDGSAGDDKNSAWREEKQKAKNGAPETSTGNLRADKLASLRQQKNKSQEEGVGGKLASAALSPVKQGTSSLLKAAWEHIIDSWGLSIIWIDIHVFLSQVLGKDLFCSLGEEWFPKGTPRNIEGAKKSVGLGETMGLSCLNLGCLFLILAILSIIAMIAAGLDHPLQAAWALMKELADLIAEIFK